MLKHARTAPTHVALSALFAAMAAAVLVCALALAGCSSGGTQDAGSAASGSAAGTAATAGSAESAAEDETAASEGVTEDATEDAAETTAAPDLTGEWWPAEEADEGDSVTITYHAAIEGERIYLYLDVYSELGESGSSLWWVGTYVAPETDGAYTWESELDAELLAELADGDDVSSEESMEFTYERGVLSFSDASLSGEDVVIELVQGQGERGDVQLRRCRRLALDVETTGVDARRSPAQGGGELVVWKMSQARSIEFRA